MHHFIHSLEFWLKTRGIDPTRITLIIRAKDEPTKTAISNGIIKEFEDLVPPGTHPVKIHTIKGLRIGDIGVAITDLDHRAP